MATIRTRKRKNGKNRYQCIVEVNRGGKHIYKSKTCSSKREALNWEKKLLYEIDSGIVTKESLKKRCLLDAIQRYISTILIHKPKNAANVRQHLKWWNSQIGSLSLTDINPSVLAECRDKLLTECNEKGKIRKNNTVIRYIASISIVLEYCVKEWLWLPLNPARAIKKPHVGKGRTRFFDLEEIQSLKESCKQSGNPYLYAIFIIGLHSGMRKSEILTLQWKYVDFKNREIHLATSKNGEPRDVPLTDESLEILSFLSTKVTPVSDSLIFPSPSNPKKPIDIKSAWEVALKKSGIIGATFHTLRHTSCSYLARVGISPILIARIVGHKDSRTTDRYTHAVKTHMHEAITQLSNLIS